MRGNDLKQNQLDAAAQFLMLLNKAHKENPALDRKIEMTWDQLVRAVALYGAIRAKAVADGNSPGDPGETYITGKL